MKKITTIVGTRPEIIRLSEIIKKLNHISIHRLVHTGQNYDSALKDIFFDELGLIPPDNYLDIATGDLGGDLSKLFSGVYAELTKNRPDAVLVLGDTNSSLSLIVARRLKIPTYHLEAGNRSFDSNVPEEVNRKIVDHTADFNLVYSEHARSNLLREGLHPRTIALMGSPLNEVLRVNHNSILQSKILQKIQVKSREFILVSVHREENIDNPEKFKKIVSSIDKIGARLGLKVLCSTHPRTRKVIKKLGLDKQSNIDFLEPLGFFDYCKLQLEARLVVSDSGSISEEASLLGFRAITIRDSIERPEALESGSIYLASTNGKNITDFFELEPYLQENPPQPIDYLIGNSSERVLNYLFSTIDQVDFWSGRRSQI